MLLEFKMKNVFSYENEVKLSMLAPNNKVKQRYQDNYTNVCGYDVLKTAIIVGENAGGKSNFIEGIQYFKYLFVQNERIQTSLSTLFQLNKLDKNDKDNFEKEQSFEVILASNEKNKVFKYILKITGYGITKESLAIQSKKGETFKKVFEVSTEYSVDDSDQIIGNVDLNVKEFNNKEFETIRETLKKNNRAGLWINTFSTLALEEATDFIEEIKKLMMNDDRLALPLDTYYQISDNVFLKNNLSILKSEEYSEIFKLVDSSITGIIIDENNPLSDTIIERNIGEKVSRREVSFESSGVKQFMVFATYLYRVIYENRIAFADELDSMFNPVLTASVINFLQASETKGQLVFTTHNVFNLSFRLFLKEQMNIVAKSKKTLSSVMYSLSEFNDLRYDSNEKIYEYYMKGLLGGVGGENDF